MHHIDENPSNNDPLNLLPLCPNCHLSDQHRPTERIPKGVPSLFRQYKDPTILSPAFCPPYQRLEYLLHFTEDTDVESLEGAPYERNGKRRRKLAEVRSPSMFKLSRHSSATFSATSTT